MIINQDWHDCCTNRILEHGSDFCVLVGTLRFYEREQALSQSDMQRNTWSRQNCSIQLFFAILHVERVSNFLCHFFPFESLFLLSTLCDIPTSGVSRGLWKSNFYCGLFHVPDLGTDFDCGFFCLPLLDSLILTAGCSIHLIWTHWIWLLSLPIFEFEMGLTAGVTGQQGMLTLPRHLILPSHLSEVRVALHSIL
jgi:hypothetical protein